MPKGSDETFVEKLLEAHKDTPCLRRPIKEPCAFTVVHFVGPVVYSAPTLALALALTLTLTLTLALTLKMSMALTRSRPPRYSARPCCGRLRKAWAHGPQP